MSHSFASKVFFLVLLLLIGQGRTAHKAVAQARKHSSPAKPAKVAVMPDTTVCTYAEQMPELPEGGGMSGLVDYFYTHFDLPSAEAKEATGGSVHLEFVVTETGDVTHARIIRSGGSSINAAT